MDEQGPPNRSSSDKALTRPGRAAAERLSALALMGMVAGAVPLPIMPAALLRRVRGAVVHDVAARHGLSLTWAAREELCAPSETSKRGAYISTALFLMRRALRRFGALGVLPPAMAWLEIYALGLLFDRYLVEARTSHTVRIDREEATSVRRAIDLALRRIAAPGLAPGREPEDVPAEELRDMPTRFSDGLLLGVASLPTYLRQRLEAAFDEAFGGSDA